MDQVRGQVRSLSSLIHKCHIYNYVSHKNTDRISYKKGCIQDHTTYKAIESLHLEQYAGLAITIIILYNVFNRPRYTSAEVAPAILNAALIISSREDNFINLLASDVYIFFCDVTFNVLFETYMTYLCM